MEQQKPVPCTVSSLQFIHAGDQKEQSSGCAAVDVKFLNVFFVEIQEVHFKNYYTASLSIHAKFKAPAGREPGDSKWQPCLQRMTLMPDAHTDLCAEEYFTISPKQMTHPLLGVTALRFILYQPSPVWKEFCIEDLKFYKQTQQFGPEITLPSWIKENDSTKEETGIDKQIKGITSVADLSKDLQSLWALTSNLPATRRSTSLRRYDVDGAYEINLLSYT